MSNACASNDAYGDVLLPLDLVIGLAADQLLDCCEVGTHGRILGLKKKYDN